MEDSSKQEDEGNFVNKICTIKGCLSFVVQSLLKCLGFETSSSPQDHHCQHPPSTSDDDPVLKEVPRPPVSPGKPPQINSGGST